MPKLVKYGRKYYVRKWKRAYTRRSLSRHLAFGKSAGEQNASCTVSTTFNIHIPAYKTMADEIVTICPAFSNLTGTGEMNEVYQGICGLYSDSVMRKLFGNYGQIHIKGMYVQFRVGGFESSGGDSGNAHIRPYVFWDRSGSRNSLEPSTGTTAYNAVDIRSLAMSAGGIPFYKYQDKNFVYKCIAGNAAEQNSWLNTKTGHATGNKNGSEGYLMSMHYFWMDDYMKPGENVPCVFLPLATCAFGVDNYNTSNREIQMICDVKYYVTFRNPGTSETIGSVKDYLNYSDYDLRPQITI